MVKERKEWICCRIPCAHKWRKRKNFLNKREHSKKNIFFKALIKTFLNVTLLRELSMWKKKNFFSSSSPFLCRWNQKMKDRKSEWVSEWDYIIYFLHAESSAFVMTTTNSVFIHSHRLIDVCGFVKKEMKK
jgi:hypothetical protein